MAEMINIERRNKIEIITFVVNKINVTTIDEIKEGVSRLFDNPNSKVIIDLKSVEYIDSSGFAWFLGLHKAAKNNFGMLKFVNPEPRVSDLFHTLHLHTVFEIYDDLETCIRSFR
jgi:anti-anti-sigma factor